MKFNTFSLTLLSLCAGITHSALAQSGDLNRTILHQDSLFWQAYNTCDVDGMAAFLTDDVEFYHDKNGLTTTRASMAEAVRKGMCGNENFRLRREAVAGSVKVFPLNNYGAILSGEHVFYINEKGKKEFLDGLARFTHVWQFKDNQWKMSRILSYDHGPAPYRNTRKEISLPASQLRQYAGKYESAQAGVVTVVADGSTLKMETSNSKTTLYAETERMFFMKERDLQFEFVVTNEKVTKMLVHEHGNKVDEATKKL